MVIQSDFEIWPVAPYCVRGSAVSWSNEIVSVAKVFIVCLSEVFAVESHGEPNGP